MFLVFPEDNSYFFTPLTHPVLPTLNIANMKVIFIMLYDYKFAEIEAWGFLLCDAI